jgi:nucleoid DNA-binding protein
MITPSSMQNADNPASDQPTFPGTPREAARTTGFNKREFGKLVAARFGVTQEVGMLFFDEIGQRMSESLAGGETVFLFGQGTLKVVKKRGLATDEVRIRFRPTTRAEKASTIVLEGLPGIAAGVIKDAVPIKSVSAGDRAIQAGRACTAEGVGGGLVVYQDDSGQYRCILLASGAAPAEAIMGTKTAAKAWLREAFATIRS